VGVPMPAALWSAGGLHAPCHAHSRHAGDAGAALLSAAAAGKLAQAHGMLQGGPHPAPKAVPPQSCQRPDCSALTFWMRGSGATSFTLFMDDTAGRRYSR